MARTISARVDFGDQHWVAMFEIDGIEYGTQAKKFRDLSKMVVDAASLLTEIAANEFEVAFSFTDEEFSELIRNYEQLREESNSITQKLSKASRETVRKFKNAGVSSRDTAAIMGITPGRVSQLA